MEEKEDIKRVLKLLSEKLKLPENKELMEGFVKELLPFCSTGDFRIDEIYELCVEKIITEQANMFYKDFPITEIKSQLITDFIQMENFRRRNRFNDFCFAMYQQIEGITNNIAKNKDAVEVFDKLLGYPAYVEDGDFKKRIFNKQDGTEATILAKMLFGNDMVEKSKSALTAQYAIDKIRSIVYLVSFKCAMQYNDFNEYTYITEKLNEIYQYRNTNHRGSEINEYQRKIFNKIEPVKSKYYLKLFGVLADFVESIEAGYPLSKELIEYAKSLEKKEIKSQINIVSEAKTKKIDEKVKGLVVRINSNDFDVKIAGNTYVVRGRIQAGVKKGDVIEIDGYEKVYGNYILINNYSKI